MEGLSFTYATWWVAICLLAGLAYALIMYFRDRTFKDQGRWLNWLLGVLRFLSVSILALLLLAPILRSVQTQSQKPVVVLAQDGSESVGESLADSAAYVQAFQDLRNELSANYDVATFTFGEQVRDTLDFSFRDKKTNLADVFQQVYDLYSNQNLGAVIIGTDGIYNEGANPLYTDVRLNAPVYTIGLGDTTRHKDLVLQRVFHNRIAYLGDRFSIQVDVSAQYAAGANSRLHIARIENGQPRELAVEPVTIDRNDFFLTKEFILDADRAGVNRFRITLDPVDGEQSRANNSRDFFVEVLEARSKILILAKAPHPDLTALRQSLTGGRNNEVEVAYANRFSGNLQDYDLVIFHQLPSISDPVSNLINQQREFNIPAWYIVGQFTNLNSISRVQQQILISGRGTSSNEVQAIYAPEFSLFNVSEELRAVLPVFPPLIAPFGEFVPGGSASVMLRQRIGRIDTEYPLLSMGEEEGTRVAVLAATGLWQWRLFDYLERKNHDRFDELVSQIVQYLSIKDDKRRFRVDLPKNIFEENEPIVFDAELYNESYELINDPSATLVITDSDGREFNYTFNATGSAYRLNAGSFPAGDYRFTASVNTGTETLDYNGQFTVQPIQLERFVTTADHNLLQLLSERYGGEFLAPTQLGELPGKLAERGTVKPVIYQTATTRSVINLKGIFFLVLLLLSLEWFLRRYYGSY
ncbi:MAG: hypothetical protein KDC54_11220 [Lewinella sp.]|nr:hypothetical protein [Lewinella sp.]